MRTEIVSDGEEATLVYVVLSWAWALEISRREGRGAEQRGAVGFRSSLRMTVLPLKSRSSE
jgi:hypothetical protein